MWEQGYQCCSPFQSFNDKLKNVFDCAVSGREAARVLVDLGIKATRLLLIIPSSSACWLRNWNVEAQWDMFLHRLADRTQNEIYALELPTALEDLIDLAIQVDAWLQH